ncbi:MAG: FAD-dependent oxidoreductase [Desulfobacterales bacterium]|nr:FAD-dependent oxidoreductase [Desulfobacterales bacterium]
MGKHLVLIGGGHAHMLTLANLDKFIGRDHNVTVIGPSPYHYYSGMGPGMLGGTYTPDDIRFRTRHVVEKQGGKFILGETVQVDPEGRTVRLKTGDTLPYDVLSFNTGSYVPRTNVSGNDVNIFTVKPIEKLLEARQQILAMLSRKNIAIGIVGGGPSAIEIAGNIRQLSKKAPHQPSITIYAGKQLMSQFPENLRHKAAASLGRRGIHVDESGYAREISTENITLESGRSYPADMIFLALGVIPSPIFKDSNLPTGPDGGLLVNRFLQSTQYPELFGGGDCIYFKDRPLNKVGVYAVRQNPVLLHNLMAALEGSALMPFDPGGDYLLIFNMGDGTGILQKRWLLFGGRLAFFIKDRIDRKFMRKFQSIE